MKMGQSGAKWMSHIWVICEICKGVGCKECDYQGGYLAFFAEDEDDSNDDDEDTDKSK